MILLSPILIRPPKTKASLGALLVRITVLHTVLILLGLFVLCPYLAATSMATG